MFVTLTIIVSFLIGFFIPFLSRRFAKFMPADSATTIVMLCHFPRFPKGLGKSHNLKFKKLWQKLLWGSFLCGSFCGLLAALFLFKTSVLAALFLLFFCLMMIFMAFIDARFHILPDVFTVPLLISGFTAAYFLKQIDISESIYGACFGYLIPTLSGIIMHFRHPRAIGGGDIKLLSALGAWFGIIGLNVVIVLSVIFFAIYGLISKQNAGPYGPSIAIASIIIVVIHFLDYFVIINDVVKFMDLKI